MEFKVVACLVKYLGIMYIILGIWKGIIIDNVYQNICKVNSKSLMIYITGSAVRFGKGGLISERFSLWIKSPIMGA